MSSLAAEESTPTTPAPADWSAQGPGRFWPDEPQTLLLHAALGSGDDAIDAWTRWKKRGSLDGIDPGSFQLLPLLYVNLRRLGLDDPQLGTLRGLYRQSWYRNQILLHHTLPVVRVLRASGIDTLVLKGAALGSLHYRDAGARPMGDLDVLVPHERAQDAMAALTASGWITPNFSRPEILVETRPAVAFADVGNRCIDLHWHALWHAAADEAFWSGAIPLSLKGVETLTLNPSDQLIHACIHGVSHGPQSSAHLLWIADAVTVIRSTGSSIDWTRLEQHAKAWRFTVALGVMLRYLGEEFEAEIPEELLRRLEGLRSPRSERAAFRAAMSPPSARRTLRIILDRYRRIAPPQPGWRRALGFPIFLSRLLGFERPWQLPVHVARRVAQHGVGRLRRAAA